jgi:hypothetical protein
MVPNRGVVVVVCVAVTFLTIFYFVVSPSQHSSEQSLCWFPAPPLAMASILDSSWNCYDTDGLFLSPTATYDEARTAAPPPVDPDEDMRPISGPLPTRKTTPAYDKVPTILPIDGRHSFMTRLTKRGGATTGKTAATRGKEASSSTTTSDNDFHTLTYENRARSQRAGNVSKVTNHV